MSNFVAHFSVRLRGTENNYEPLLCRGGLPDCKMKVAHYHCPLCSIYDVYQDPVILRAHFRVKHVDKGVEFAGLKVLRCCDHCSITGTIKGTKHFKGSHWHCYRCKNGFNRKDEAVKHFKTHFRNPETTFQIHLVHDIHQHRRAVLTKGDRIGIKSISGLTALTEAALNHSEHNQVPLDESIKTVEVDGVEMEITDLPIAHSEVVTASSEGDQEIVNDLTHSENGISVPLAVISEQKDNVALMAEVKQLNKKLKMQISENMILRQQNAASQAKISKLHVEVRSQQKIIERMKKQQSTTIVQYLEKYSASSMRDDVDRLRNEYDGMINKQLDELQSRFYEQIISKVNGTDPITEQFNDIEQQQERIVQCNDEKEYHISEQNTVTDQSNSGNDRHFTVHFKEDGSMDSQETSDSLHDIQTADNAIANIVFIDPGSEDSDILSTIQNGDYSVVSLSEFTERESFSANKKIKLEGRAVNP